MQASSNFQEMPVMAKESCLRSPCQSGSEINLNSEIGQFNLTLSHRPVGQAVLCPPRLPTRASWFTAPYLSHGCQEVSKVVCASAAGHRAALISPAFSGRLERCRKERPQKSLPRRFFKGRDRRAAAPRRRAQRQAPENASQGGCLIPFVPPSRAGASQRDALYLLGWRNLILKPVPE